MQKTLTNSECADYCDGCRYLITEKENCITYCKFDIEPEVNEEKELECSKRTNDEEPEFNF